MTGIFNALASGARSLSFAPTMKMPEFEHKPYESRIKVRAIRKPRTPQEIMRSAWEDVGNHIWDAMKTVEREYGQQIT